MLKAARRSGQQTTDSVTFNTDGFLRLRIFRVIDYAYSASIDYRKSDMNQQSTGRCPESSSKKPEFTSKNPDSIRFQSASIPLHRAKHVLDIFSFILGNVTCSYVQHSPGPMCCS